MTVEFTFQLNFFRQQPFDLLTIMQMRIICNVIVNAWVGSIYGRGVK
jgi:hypothetical protein